MSFYYARRLPTELRFFEYLMPVTESGCHLWLGEESHNGYGRFAADGRRIPAHRFAWIKAYGPIPAGLLVCHKCDTPQCCNPQHLFLGTYKENKNDSMCKGRHTRGRAASLARASILNESLARQIFEASGTHQAIANRFHVTRQLVSKVKARDAWDWIHSDPRPTRTDRSHGETHHQAKLTEEIVLRLIAARLAGRGKVARVAAELRIPYATAMQAATGLTWRYLHERDVIKTKLPAQEQ